VRLVAHPSVGVPLVNTLSAISYPLSAWVVSVLLALTSPVQGNEETSMKQTSVASKELRHEVTFDQDIFPLFDRNCLVCHGPGVQRAGLDLRSKESVLRGSASGPVIRPGNAEESLLYQLITHQKEPAMPMGGKLGESEIATIADWINSLSPLERESAKLPGE